MYRVIFSLLIVHFISQQTNGQQTDSSIIRQIVNYGLSSSSAYENLRSLCKDIGPRLSGSENAAKAIKWGLKKMMDAGADTAYLQPCRVTHWVRGEKETGFIKTTMGNYSLSLCALGNSVGTGSKGITAPIVEVNDFNELDRLGEKGIKGKIVFFNYPMKPTFVNTFEAYGDAAGYRVIGPSKAARYGAIGTMVRSLAVDIQSYPHTGMLYYLDSMPKIPAVAISTSDAEWLSDAIKKNIVVNGGFTTHCEMLGDVLSYNVIGELRGSTKPDEIITVGGHLDSWDLAEGAQDDGAGCVQSIAVIETLTKLNIRPQRTIRAVLFMNEENGNGGGRAYRDSAVSKKENQIFALESDAGGFTPRGFGISEKGYEKVKTWEPLLKPYGICYIRKGGEGEDIRLLAKTGTVIAGLEPDSQRYFDIHHAVTDVFERVSKRELDLGMVNMTALVWLVSKYGIN